MSCRPGLSVQTWAYFGGRLLQNWPTLLQSDHSHSADVIIDTLGNSILKLSVS